MKTLLISIRNCLRFSNNDSMRFDAIRFNRKSQFKRINLLLQKLGTKNNFQIIRCVFVHSPNIKQIMRTYFNVSFNFSYDLIDFSYTNNILRYVFGQTTDRQNIRSSGDAKKNCINIQLTMCANAAFFLNCWKSITLFLTRSLFRSLPFFYDEYWICAQWKVNCICYPSNAWKVYIAADS